MKTALQQLSELVPPPAAPQNAKGDWNRIEHELGLELPSDYKQYIELYGSGTLCSLFSIPSPFSLEKQYKKNIRDAWISWVGIYSCWGEEPEDEVPFALYPKVPGLLPWGTYGDVDVLGWLTDNDSNTWHVVYFDEREGFFELQEMDFLTFLSAALNGEVPLSEAVFGKHILEEKYIFKPY